MKKFDIDRIASLIRLELSDTERAELSRDMEEIVRFAGEISRPTDSPRSFADSEQPSRFRDDIPFTCLDRDILLSASASRTDEYICVSRAVGGEE